LVDWPDDFDRWLTAIEDTGGPIAEIILALLQTLTELESEPVEEVPRSNESGKPNGIGCGGSRIRTNLTLRSGSCSGLTTTGSSLHGSGSTRRASVTFGTPARP
jgi:hypothetical protein